LPELVFASFAAVVVGAVVARWWLVALPLVAALAWTGYAAAFSGEDSDGMPVWQITLAIGGALAFMLAVALTAGVVVGRWWRARRDEHGSNAPPDDGGA
jgi:uncharacterized RDD family membrane protein YckC